MTVELRTRRTEASSIALGHRRWSGYRDALFTQGSIAPAQPTRVGPSIHLGLERSVTSCNRPANGSGRTRHSRAPEPRPVLNCPFQQRFRSLGGGNPIHRMFDSSDLLIVTSSIPRIRRPTGVMHRRPTRFGHVGRTRAITETFQIGVWSEVWYFRLRPRPTHSPATAPA